MPTESSGIALGAGNTGVTSKETESLRSWSSHADRRKGSVINSYTYDGGGGKPVWSTGGWELSCKSCSEVTFEQTSGRRSGGAVWICGETTQAGRREMRRLCGRSTPAVFIWVKSKLVILKSILWTGWFYKILWALIQWIGNHWGVSGKKRTQYDLHWKRIIWGRGVHWGGKRRQQRDPTGDSG